MNRYAHVLLAVQLVLAVTDFAVSAGLDIRHYVDRFDAMGGHGDFIWMNTGERVFRINVNDGTETVYEPEALKLVGEVRVIEAFETGDVWFGAEKGLSGMMVIHGPFTTPVTVLSTVR